MNKFLSNVKHFFTKEGFLSFLKAFYHSYVWLIIVIFIIDIASKWAVQNNLEVGESVSIIPNFLYVTLVHNMGAAFGMGNSGDLAWRIVWILISLIMSVALSVFYALRGKKLHLVYKIGVVMMIAGAIGNLIDRAFYWDAIVGFDGVIDWIQFVFGSYRFATFNIADSSLVIGVVVLLIGMIVELIQDTIKNKKEGVYDIEPDKLNKSDSSDTSSSLDNENNEGKASDENKHDN